MINNRTIQPIFEFSNIIRMKRNMNDIQSPYLFQSGRHSLFFILSRIKNIYKKNHIIMLPYLICNEIIPIIEYLDIKIKYYKVFDNLQPDYESIRANLDQDNSILLVVNYFGFPSNWDEINSIKEEFHCLVIEDNAHAIYGEYNNKSLGTLGDVSFNSIRKILPLLGGSQLIINNYSLGDIPNESRTRLPNLGELAYSLRQFNIFKSKDKEKKVSKTENTKFMCQPADVVSRRIFNNVEFNEKNIIKKRRENYVFWNEYLKNKNLLFFEDLKLNHVCPYVFPCSVKSKKDIGKWVEWGRYNKINIISWPKFPISIDQNKLSPVLKNLIFFPVNHQHTIANLIKE